MKKKWLRIILPLAFLLLAVPVFILSSRPLRPLTGQEYDYWLVDMETNSYLTHTSTPLSVGDEYLSSDNRIYRIIKISKDKAYVREIH